MLRKKNDFDVEDKEHSDAQKKFEDEELEALFHEDFSRMKVELAEPLRVDYTSFNIFENIRNDSKARTGGAV